MRIFLGLAVAAVLAGCATNIPDSAAGVGFEDYDSYEARRAREASLSGATTVRSPADAGDDPSIEAISEAAIRAANSGADPVDASPANPPPALNNPGISDENDFGAVSNRQSIESDADRIARNRDLYKVIQPTALPPRSGAGGPNIVDYALRTSHSRGTRVYPRTGLNAQNRYTRNCAKYASPDQSQVAFLANGGPEKDRLGLDPDGDGFACQWDPEPFRSVKRAAAPTAGQ